MTSAELARAPAGGLVVGAGLALVSALLLPGVEGMGVVLGILSVALATAPGFWLLLGREEPFIFRTAYLVVGLSCWRTIGSAVVASVLLVTARPDPASLYLTVVCVAWCGLIGEAVVIVRRFGGASGMAGERA